MLNLSAALIFRNPQILWFLSIIIIPIIVHLFNLRRTKKIVFSNTSFLKKVKEESTAKRKPKELLVLLSRILGLVFLVLAFAKPIIQESSNGATVSDSVIIYLDNSPSHLIQTSGIRSFDKSINTAQAIVDNYPEGTDFYFIENSYSNSIQITYTKRSLSDLLTETDVVNIGRSSSEIQDRVNTLNVKGDLFWISDFNAASKIWDIDTLLNYNLVPVNSNVPTNVFIDTVYLENSFYSGSFSNELVIELGSEGIDNTNVSARVYIGGQLTGTLSIEVSNNSGIGRFEIAKDATDIENILINIDDQTTSFDNDFYLSINSLKLTNVLEIHDSNSTGFVSQLFAENEYFNFIRSSADRIDEQAFANADFIIVNGVNSYSNQLMNELKKAIERGASLVIIPAIELSSAQLADLGVRITNDAAEKVNIQTPNFTDPFFEGVFEEEDANMQMPFGTTDFRLMNVEYSLLEFLNGRPFLAKATNDFNVFAFATSFDQNRTSFVNHALFVPVFYRLALGSKRNFANLYHYTDAETISYPLQSRSGNQIFDLSNEELNITPDQRQTSSELIMYIPKDEIVPGSFTLQSSESNLGRIAFNLPKSESIGNPDREKVLNELVLQDNVEIFEVDNAEEFAKELKAELDGVSLWRAALLLGLLFLFVEIILIRYL